MKDQAGTSREPDPGAIDWAQCPGIERDPDRMSGAWCFEGTRITVASLFEHLAEGIPIQEYIDDYPDVRTDRVLAVLKFQADRLTAVWDQ